VDFTAWMVSLSEWLGVVALTIIAGAAPALKKIRRVEFLYTRREFNYAFFIFAIDYVFAYLYFTNPFFSFLRKFADQFWGGETAERTLLALICLLPFLVALIARKQPFKSIGWHNANLRAALSVGFLLALLTIFLRGKFMTILGGVTKDQGAALGIYLLLAVAEETIFRGYIQPRMQGFIGHWWGWLATAGLYTLWQLPGRIWLMPFTSLWIILLTALIQGLILGFIMNKTGHVIAPILYRAFSAWVLVL
jgi:membrane protease YdiL (CAAX protease family)